MEKIKVGVVGTGHLGNFHTKMFAQIPAVELVGIFDVDPAKANKVAAEHKTNAFSDYEKLLDAVQAVSIASTTVTHFDVARRALERGVHVFIEKPITETIEQARTLVNLADERKVAIQVGHIERAGVIL